MASGWPAIYPRLQIEWLPTYASELNPVEYVWSYFKGHRMANHGLCELDDIQERAQREAQSARRNQPLLRSFVHAAGLPIKSNQ